MMKKQCTRKSVHLFSILTLSVILIAAGSTLAFAAEEGHSLGKELPLWSCIPFAGMLLSIAIFPLVRAEWWEHNMFKVAMFWSFVFLIPFGIVFGSDEFVFNVLEIVLLDYLPFIVLLFGLFVVTGGISLEGTLIGTPKTNIVLLLIGTAMSSWVGTTGASMLMIHPLVHANQWREKKAHIVVFFIFLVSNMGGCLTPVGDPPLFLGFLRGVPFFWTMKMLPLLLLNTAVLLAVLFIMDTHYYKKEIAADRSPQDMLHGKEKEPLRIRGGHNFIFIFMIVGAVILNGVLAKYGGVEVYHGIVVGYNSMVQMAIILLAALLSWKTTKQYIREENDFTWAPIAEVAKLFIGIFLTMIPALAILKADGASLGLTQPWQFFWITGALSSFLDNAPTYLVFMTTAGTLGFTEGLATTVGTIAPNIMLAVSAGAVFMGANTYIGNAPNFMVHTIAEENKIKMPSFFGYIGWSLCFLVPVFILDTVIFFL